MKVWALVRDHFSSTDTLGWLGLDNRGVCATIERSKTDPSHPCIPCGRYRMRRTMFYGGDGVGGKRDYVTYEITGVPGRSQIKVHVANAASELLGCVAPGVIRVVNESGPSSVSHSQIAFDDFMRLADGDEEMDLVIAEAVAPID